MAASISYVSIFVNRVGCSTSLAASSISPLMPPPRAAGFVQRLLSDQNFSVTTQTPVSVVCVLRSCDRLVGGRPAAVAATRYGPT
jgi:hypothetical protein